MKVRRQRLGIRCSRGVRSIYDPFVLYSYNISTLSQSIRSDLMGLDHPVLRRAAGNFFKGDMDGRKKVNPMMVLLVAWVMSEVEDADASEAKEQTEMTQTTTRTLLTPPQPW